MIIARVWGDFEVNVLVIKRLIALDNAGKLCYTVNRKSDALDQILHRERLAYLCAFLF